MAGPLTPPPTSAIEIEDAVRDSMPPEAPLPAPAEGLPLPTLPTPGPEAATAESHISTTVYRQQFPRILELISNGNFEELVDVAEIGDLNAREDGNTDRLLLTVPLVLGYLILDDIPPAIHALGRLPDMLTINPIVRALSSLAASVGERKYDHIYPRVSDVHNAAQQVDISGIDLKPVVDGLLDRFLDAFRRKTFVLLSRAYSSIPLALTQTYLGFSAEQVLNVASEHKWSYDTNSQTLSPVAPPRNASSNGQLPSQSTLATFNLIAGINLE